VLAWPDTIFFILQKTYIYIQFIFNIKKFEHDVLLVKQLHLVSPALLSGHGFELPSLHYFLTFYADLIKWADGLTGWPGTVSRPA
jgi:hypothetical protein